MTDADKRIKDVQEGIAGFMESMEMARDIDTKNQIYAASTAGVTMAGAVVVELIKLNKNLSDIRLELEWMRC